MGRVWSWIIVKKSNKNPYIKIPREILKELDLTMPKSYYVILAEAHEDAEKIVECLNERRGER